MSKALDEIVRLSKKLKEYNNCKLVSIVKPIMIKAYMKNIFNRTDAITVASAVLAMIENADKEEIKEETHKEKHDIGQGCVSPHQEYQKSDDITRIIKTL